MPRLIKVTADNEVSVINIPDDIANDSNKYFPHIYSLIGNDCSFIEPVYPNRLYEDWGFDDMSVYLIVDDMGAMSGDCKRNLLGSFLYGEAEHGSSLYGTILFVESHDSYDDDFECHTKLGLSDDNIKKFLSNAVEFYEARGLKYSTYDGTRQQ